MINKIITWLKVNGATIIGLVQAVLKAVKEILTGVINILSLFVSASGAQAFVEKIRDFINTIDSYIENWKAKLLEAIL
jgi:hypothetical protein